MRLFIPPLFTRKAFHSNTFRNIETFSSHSLSQQQEELKFTSEAIVAKFNSAHWRWKRHAKRN
jgi:hypothetical protein